MARSYRARLLETPCTRVPHFISKLLLLLDQIPYAVYVCRKAELRANRQNRMGMVAFQRFMRRTFSQRCRYFLLRIQNRRRQAEGVMRKRKGEGMNR